VFLDTLQRAFERRRGTAASSIWMPRFAARARSRRSPATLTVANGRVERVSYEKLAALHYTAQAFDVDLRLDQSPGVWLTAVGRLPLGLFKTDVPERRSTSPSSRAPSDSA